MKRLLILSCVAALGCPAPTAPGPATDPGGFQDVDAPADSPEAPEATAPDVELIPDPGPPPLPDPVPLNISAVWANEGGDKVTQDELRAATGPAPTSPVWDGTTIKLFAAKDEVVGFNLVLEAATAGAADVSVRFDALRNDDGGIVNQPQDAADVFNWVGRPIELFYVRYLQIKGLSLLGYVSNYDERHVPHRLRRPWTGQGKASGLWEDRPDADKMYPDIMVPLEWESRFAVAEKQNQSVWVDIHIPREQAAGVYSGAIQVWEGEQYSWELPIELEVLDFALPKTPSAKTMLAVETGDINARQLGEPYPSDVKLVAASQKLVDQHFMMAWRHRVTAVDSFADSVDLYVADVRRLDGSLFTAKNGYAGPGEGRGVGLYVIGLYGGWMVQWDEDSAADMQAKSDLWAEQLKPFPDVEAFLFLKDEPLPDTYEQVETWAQWIDQGTGPGASLPTFSTLGYDDQQAHTPSVDIPCRGAIIGDPAIIEPAYQAVKAAGHPTCAYGGMRPATGLLLTEEDGVGPRALAWTQYKHGVDRWFIWNGTYYDDYQSGSGPTDVFKQAKTFGGFDELDAEIGETGWNYTNGDGVLFYPGNDEVFPESSYDNAGPIASLRLKLWRRGLQDVDYLTLAAAIDPMAVSHLVTELLPKSLWGVGIETPEDPSYVYTDISWPVEPAAWESARRMLADIILSGL